MVFGIETTIRSLWRKPFRRRGPWETYSAIVFIVVVTTMLWLSSFLIPTSDICIGDLVWWTQHYAFIAVVLTPVIILINTLSSVTIVAQLLRSTNVAVDERIMATRYIFTSGLSTFILVSGIQSAFEEEALLTSPIRFYSFHTISKFLLTKMLRLPRTLPISYCNCLVSSIFYSSYSLVRNTIV